MDEGMKGLPNWQFFLVWREDCSNEGELVH